MRTALLGLLLILVADNKVVVVDPQHLWFHQTVVSPPAAVEAQRELWLGDLKTRYDGKEVEVKGRLVKFGGSETHPEFILDIPITLESGRKASAHVRLTFDAGEIVKQDKLETVVTITGKGKTKKQDMYLYVENAKFKRL